VIGAFVFGVVLGRDWPGGEEVRAKLEPVVLGLMLPVYFVSVGMAVNVSTLSARALWELPAILFVAYAGKLGGTLIGAAVGRVPASEARSLAALMNVRGLMELVVISVGLSAGVLDRELYALFVIMALATTMSAAPLLAWSRRRGAAVRVPAGAVAERPV
jgi:Kef-type K+ transport system membrane component KefB